MTPRNNYDQTSPMVQAIERGYEEWAEAGCHEVSCGCVTVYIYNELVKVFGRSPRAEVLTCGQTEATPIPQGNPLSAQAIGRTETRSAAGANLANFPLS